MLKAATGANVMTQFQSWIDAVNANNGVIQIALTVFQILITFFGFLLITRKQIHRDRYEERLNQLKKTVDALTVSRNDFAERALALYREHFRSDPDCSEFVEHGHLIYRNGWVNCKDSQGRFYPLSSFTPKIASRYTPPAPKKNHTLPDQQESYADNVKFYLGKTLMDLPLYGLNEVRLHPDEIEITVNLGSYFDFYNTCEYRGYEMAYARRILGKTAVSAKTLPARYGKNNEGLNLFNTSNRFPGIGINTVTILKNVLDDQEPDRDPPTRDFFLMHKRSKQVAEGIGNYHVIPAGSYQPLKDYLDHSDETRAETMKDTVLREFGEEIKDYEEFIDLNTSQLLQNLDRLLDPYFLGIGFEPLNTKTEVLSALILDLEQPKIRALFQGQRHYSQLQTLLDRNNNYEGEIHLCPLNCSTLRQYENDFRSTASMKEIMRILQLEENRAFFHVQNI